ncbi:YbjN domain-containing protein [Leptospira ryugenii]|nr:YbjN domain-containing protein [Leptospira ryugenii]
MKRFLLISLLLSFAYLPLLPEPNKPNPPQAPSAAILTKIDQAELKKLLKESQIEIVEESENFLVLQLRDYRAALFLPTEYSLQFYSSFTSAKPRAELVNRWNQKMRYSRAYTDEEGRIILESDLDLTGGVTRENIKDFFKKFQLLLGQFSSSLTLQD